MPFGNPLLSVKYAVLKQPLAPPEVTWIAQFIGAPLVRVGRGGLFKPVAAIEVAIFPDG